MTRLRYEWAFQLINSVSDDMYLLSEFTIVSDTVWKMRDKNIPKSRAQMINSYYGMHSVYFVTFFLTKLNILVIWNGRFVAHVMVISRIVVDWLPKNTGDWLLGRPGYLLYVIRLCIMITKWLRSKILQMHCCYSRRPVSSHRQRVIVIYNHNDESKLVSFSW